MELILLVLGGFWLLFMAHTLIYWLGIVPGNIGLIRVIACVAPLGAILMLAGLERILLWIRRGGVRLIVGILVLALNASMNINGLEIPLKKGQLEKTHDNLGEWYRNLDHTGMKTWTSDPQLWYYCGVDVYDQKIWAEVFYEPHALDYMKEGDLLIWDGQFGDHHQNVKFETFMENPGLKLLHIQVPEDPSLTGDRFFRIYVFRRTMDSISAEDNYSTEAALLGDTCLRVRYINLKGSNGKFVCIDLTEDGRVVCDRTEAKEWERIACKIINDSIVNLVGVGGRVLNTPEDSPGQSVWGQNAGTTGMPEFKMRKTGENKVELITPAGNYWCIDPGTGNIMLCNQSSANSVFTMEEAK